MLSKRLLILLSLLLVVVLVIPACQPTAETPKVEEEKPAEDVKVEPTKAPEVIGEEPIEEEFVVDESLVSGMVVKSVGTKPVRGGKFVMAIDNLVHLDPVSVAEDQETYVLIDETLFEFDPEWKATPLLVKSVEISPDGLVHTWKLREGVKFQDGSPFNAEIVKWNLDRKIEQQTPYYDSIPWADDPIKVIDEYTVTATLKEPFFVMYQYLSGSSFMMYSKTFVESHTPDDLKNQAVGTGPYIVKEYRPNDVLLLERNPNYWQKGLPFFDEIEIRIVPDAQSRLLMLEAGEIDFAKDLSIQDLKRVEGNPKIMATTGPSSRIYHIIPHQLRPPLENVNVRKAFNLAIDKDAMNKTIFDDRYVIATGFATPNIQGYTPFEPLPYDPEEAKRLLDEAGLVDTNGDGFRELGRSR